jgi:hypothetical protein
MQETMTQFGSGPEAVVNVRFDRREIMRGEIAALSASARLLHARWAIEQTPDLVPALRQMNAEMRRLVAEYQRLSFAPRH